MDVKNKYTHRQLARIVIEAETPLIIGSGEKSITTDSLIMLDVNGFPYIPGTSLAGVLRHYYESIDITHDNSKVENDLFGFQTFEKGEGSRLIFTDAKLVGHDSQVIDGLEHIDLLTQKDEAFYSLFKELPIRQHTRINHKGVVKNSGKFDQQVIYKGTRFCFEIEFLSEKAMDLSSDDCPMKSLFDILYAPEFRIGGGTRKGFGKIKVVDLDCVDLDLCVESQRKHYLEKSSALSLDFWNTKFENRVRMSDFVADLDKSTQWLHYQLELKPDDFYLFGAGFGDDEVDAVPVDSTIIEWHGGKASPSKRNHWLIPGSSVKGAIAHRVAYHYNKLAGHFADQLSTDAYDKLAENNFAVNALFGTNGTNSASNRRGHVMVSDVFIPKKEPNAKANSERTDEHIFNHVKIDGFTGGGIDGALFSEKAVYGKKQTIHLDIMLDIKSLEDAADLKALRVECEKEGLGDEIHFDETFFIKAFEATLNDLCTGLLPLGGCVNKGYGCFTGTIVRNHLNN